MKRAQDLYPGGGPKSWLKGTLKKVTDRMLTVVRAIFGIHKRGRPVSSQMTPRNASDPSQDRVWEMLRRSRDEDGTW